MLSAVADTHIVIWHLFNDSRISASVQKFIDDSIENGQQVAVASISLIEIVYLQEKGRLADSVYETLIQALAIPEPIFIVEPLTIDITRSLHKVSRDAVPDMPDRIIAATALHFGVPLLTRDRRVRLADLDTIW